jgi:hypothetical protein
VSVARYFVFWQVPTLWTLTGAVVVILSGLYLFARDRKALGPQATGPAYDIATR